MNYLEYLLNISVWHVIVFFGVLLIINIIIAGVIIVICSIGKKLFFKKKINFKSALIIFCTCYVIISFVSLYFLNRNFRTRLNNFNEAISRINELIKSNPQDANNYFSRGMEYANNFCYDKALKDFKKALSLNPNMPAANNYVGFIYIAKGRFDKAEEYCKKAIEQTSNFSKPYFNLARIYKHREDFDNAMYQITKALEYEPNFYEAYILRAEIFIDKEEYANAISDLKKAIKLNPPSKNLLEGWIKKLSEKLN